METISNRQRALSRHYLVATRVRLLLTIMALDDLVKTDLEFHADDVRRLAAISDDANELSQKVAAHLMTPREHPGRPNPTRTESS